MATLGPLKIADGGDDGGEVSDTTWQATGLDSDGIVVGNRDSDTYDMGMRWSLAIPQGATINSCTIRVFAKYNEDPSDIDTVMEGFDEDNTAAFSAGNRPSQRTKTTASVTHTYTNAEYSDEAYFTLEDAASILQEVVNRPGWSSGNYFGVVLRDNGSSADERWQFQDYDRESTEAAEITVDYTAASNITVEVPLGPIW